jgi:hypothetical protein
MQNTSREINILLTVHLDAVLGNDQLDALFLNVFILCLYMFPTFKTQVVILDYLISRVCYTRRCINTIWPS